MVVISEWLPNPAGSDAAGEWVELENTGSETVHLAGWSIAADGGKRHALGAADVLPGGFAVFPRSAIRITLKNRSGSLDLFNASSERVDTIAFRGEAPEGKSVNRGAAQPFFGEPTPGRENASFASLALAGDALPFETPLDGSGGGLGAAAGTVVVGAAFAAFALYLVKRHDALSELFFGGN